MKLWCPGVLASWALKTLIMTGTVVEVLDQGSDIGIVYLVTAVAKE